MSEEYGFGKTSEGWDDREDLYEVIEVIEKVEKLAYELRNCRRNSYAKFGDSIPDLIDHLQEIGENFTALADYYQREHGDQEEPEEEEEDIVIIGTEVYDVTCMNCGKKFSFKEPIKLEGDKSTPIRDAAQRKCPQCGETDMHAVNSIVRKD